MEHGKTTDKREKDRKDGKNHYLPLSAPIRVIRGSLFSFLFFCSTYFVESFYEYSPRENIKGAKERFYSLRSLRSFAVNPLGYHGH